jgi:hypothetical protein
MTQVAISEFVAKKLATYAEYLPNAYDYIQTLVDSGHTVLQIRDERVQGILLLVRNSHDHYMIVHYTGVGDNHTVIATMPFNEMLAAEATFQNVASVSETKQLFSASELVEIAEKYFEEFKLQREYRSIQKKIDELEHEIYSLGIARENLVKKSWTLTMDKSEHCTGMSRIMFSRLTRIPRIGAVSTGFVAGKCETHVFLTNCANLKMNIDGDWDFMVKCHDKIVENLKKYDSVEDIWLDDITEQINVG